MALPDTLVIAEGSEWETTCYDARDLQAWSKRSGPDRTGPPSYIFWHHSVSWCPADDPEGQLSWLIAHIHSGKHGWPYQWVVFPWNNRSIFYLNDADSSRPHTYRYNRSSVAICAIGNYETNEPDGVLPGVMWHLSNALRIMWGQDIPIMSHRDVSATACPGKHLHAALVDLRRG